MNTAVGTWSGISIDLWREVAKETRVQYEFSERANVQDLLDGLTNGSIDIAIGALTITGPRARTFDFSVPFYSTGLGIAVSADKGFQIIPLIKSFFTAKLLTTIFMVLLISALIVGFVFWLFERRQHEDFASNVINGVSSSVWWATATMTRRAMHSYGPRTLSGRILAILWMVTSVIAIAVFTAAITSALTIKQLQGEVQGVNDLSRVRVGAVSGTSTQDALSERKIAYRAFANPQDALHALRTGSIGAVVYDRPLLTWLIGGIIRNWSFWMRHLTRSTARSR